MAIFQFQMQIIGRSEGRSAVAAAAYRSAQKIENQYTGITEDYTRKNWLEYSEIMLPENAPDAFRDRAVLWNSVETTEKGRNARLAREIEVALPLELSMEENIQLVRSFVMDSFVSDGMVADVNIHNPPVTDENGKTVDTAGNPASRREDMVFRNPHAHIMLTVRPLDEAGKWMPKAQKEYICKKGNQTAAFTAEEFQQKKSDGWQKEYQYWIGKKKVWLTPSDAYDKNLVRVSKNPRSTPYGRRDEKSERWNSPDAVKEYRKSWEIHVNGALERAGRPERIDSRSYQEQGKDTVSGIHLGPYASKSQNSDHRQINEEIASLNQKNKKIRESLDGLENQLREKKGQLSDIFSKQLGEIRSDIIVANYKLESLLRQQEAIRQDIQKLERSISHVQNARQTLLEKDRVAKETIFLLKKELQGSFPPFSHRPGQIQAEIQAEENRIQFRKERFQKLLAEEGFSSFTDFQQESRILSQMKEEDAKITQAVSAYQKQIQEHTARYQKLAARIPADFAFSPEFQEKTQNSFHQYERQAVEHIRRHTNTFKIEAFQKAVHKTDYVLNRAASLAGHASYLMAQIHRTADTLYGDERHRNI